MATMTIGSDSPSPSLDYSRRILRSSKRHKNNGENDKTSNKVQTLKHRCTPRCRHELLRHMNLPRKLDLHDLRPYKLDWIKGCATLAIQNHSLRNLQNWRVLNILEAFEMFVSGHTYYLTFEAVKADQNGKVVQQKIFEAHVWNGRSQRRVNGIRTIRPHSKWYPGNLWIPLTGPRPELKDLVSHPPPPDFLARLRTIGKDYRRKSVRLEEYNRVVPPKIYGDDSRIWYNEQSNKRAKKSLENNNQAKKKYRISDETLALQSDPVKLNLHKLSDSEFGILEDCAILAMQDHLIQTINLEWRDWRLLKIQKALRLCINDGGYNYFLTFQAGKGDRVRTLEAEVWDDGISQRRVNRFKTITPRSTEWHPGNFWIPV